MPEVLDWLRGDPRLALQRALEELAAGNLVVFPTETGYHFAVEAGHANAASVLGQLAPEGEAVLAVRGLNDALRWAPWLSTTARRLARRCWPGPVTLVVDRKDDAPGQPCFAVSESSLRLWAPAHEVPLAALEHVSEGLVLAPVGGELASVEQPGGPLSDRVALVIADGPAAKGSVATVIRVNDAGWEVTCPGTMTAEELKRMMLTTILFVCTGNTCRSPLAEALCKKLLAERHACRPDELPGRGFQVLSAGLAAMMGAAATPEAALAARECGADLSNHCSQPLTPELLARADYLFAMTHSHLSALLSCCGPDDPQARLLAPDGSDVPDPIGGEQQVYRDCAQQILRHLNDCLPYLQPL
jgi:protein-tyrosine phosphatase